MIDRAMLKQRGMAAFKANYGAAVLAGLLLSFATGASATVSSRVGGGSNLSEQISEAADELVYSGYMSTSTIVTMIMVIFGIVAVASVIAIAIQVFLKNPLQVGTDYFFLKNSYYPKTQIEEVITPFKTAYKNTVVVMFMKNLFISLWSLLLIIPGIIKSYEYKMVTYILAENPDMDWQSALAASRQMMNGHKMDAFVFELSFLGWELLGLFTCGILIILYVQPYKQASMAEFYRQLREEQRTMGYAQ